MMATAESVKGKLRGLIDSANSVTGNSDPDLTTAVDSLIAGFGQGSGGSDGMVGLLDGTLEVVESTEITKIRSYAFYYHSMISKFTAPNLVSMGANAFRYCTLEFFDAPVTTIPASCFSNCSMLKVLVLRSKSVCTLSSANAFNYSPFAYGNAGGTVYVPEALISQYQAAANWSTLYEGGTCTFAVLEGSEYE